MEEYKKKFHKTATVQRSTPVIKYAISPGAGWDGAFGLI